MGFWSNLRDDFNRITRPYDEQEDEPMEFEEQEEEETPVRPERPARSERRSSRPAGGEYTGKVVNLHSNNQLKVVLVKPTQFDEDTREIAEHLLSKRTVVVNLEKTDPEIAQRILDFIVGVNFAIDGEMKLVAAKTYIVTPYHGAVEGAYFSELDQNDIF